MSFEKYIHTQHNMVRDFMLGAAEVDHWYTVEQIANITELSVDQVARSFQEIRKQPYLIRKRNAGGQKYEYLIKAKSDVETRG